MRHARFLSIVAHDMPRAPFPELSIYRSVILPTLLVLVTAVAVVRLSIVRSAARYSLQDPVGISG